MKGDFRSTFHGFSIQSEFDLGLPMLLRDASTTGFQIRSNHIKKPSFWTIESELKNSSNQPQFRVRQQTSGFVFEYPERCLIRYHDGSFNVDSSFEQIERCVPYLLSRPVSLAIENCSHFVLHAASCLVDGCLVAIMGPSGVGKTTLSLALAERGHVPHTELGDRWNWGTGHVEVAL